jgi:hypothetical protein
MANGASEALDLDAITRDVRTAIDRVHAGRTVWDFRALVSSIAEKRGIATTECVHRAMPNTDSGASRTPIPTEAEHRFRAVRTA